MDSHFQKSFSFNNEKIYKNSYNTQRVPYELLLSIRKNPQAVRNFKIQKMIFEKIYVCGICFLKTHWEDMISLGSCQHVYCKNCLLKYVDFKINVQQKIFCPSKDCPEILSLFSIFYKQLPEHMKNKFIKQQIWNQNISNPKIKICPNQNCFQGVLDSTVNPTQCTKCHTKYCLNCLNKFHKGICKDNYNNFQNFMRRCPSCSKINSKKDSSYFVTCSCSNTFCFVCLGDKQEHFQGKCPEKISYDFEQSTKPQQINEQSEGQLKNLKKNKNSNLLRQSIECLIDTCYFCNNHSTCCCCLCSFLLFLNPTFNGVEKVLGAFCTVCCISMFSFN